MTERLLSYTTKLLPIIAVAVLFFTSQPVQAFDGCKAVDFDDDGVVSLSDLVILNDPNVFGQPNARLDVDGSGAVDLADFYFLAGFIGQTCSGCTANLVSPARPPVVDGADRSALESAYGRDCRGDLNRDGVVDDDLDNDLFGVYLNNPAPPGSPQARADFNEDQVVDLLDVNLFVAMIGTDCTVDLNKDGAVDTNDLWALLAAWGPCP
ncbi:MAG: hypothetical protein K0U98_07715 [Deltaproteobacteria bacterium]|nr:hypothetical protein [Deltaproteobacteria bacterium]